ncbi:MAG: NnrS family protein [Candidatus Dactylopiibacterium sp.]|nr:NnrS family protein [Candidatus Dactylopiibacterium sp.]
MPPLLRIEEPATAAPHAPQWQAFLEMGFRPLYLAGCAWAALSVALWVFAPQWILGPLNAVFWHAHEMLWGFVATIAVGFLLTAGGAWTGVNPMRGRPLAALCGLWLAARILFLVPGTVAFGLAALCELAFFAWGALAMGRVVYGQRSQRNYGVPVLMLALGAADALFLLAVARGEYDLLLSRFNTGLLCMAVIALLVTRRVTPFFASRAVPGLEIPMQLRSGHVQLATGCAAILFSLLGWSLPQALALAITGALPLYHVISWKPLAVRHKPILWILYAGYAGLGAGLLLAAAHEAGWILREAWPAHAIGTGGFAVLIIGMVTRTALGHLGRPLQTDRSMVASYVLVIVAAVLRLVALVPGGFTLAALHASTTAWVLAFALYLWRFVPYMIRPRADAGVAGKNSAGIPLRPGAKK